MQTARLSFRLSLLTCALLLAGTTAKLDAQYQVTTLGATITENFDTYASVTGIVAPTFATALNVNTNTTAVQRGNAWSYYNATNNQVVTNSTNFLVNDIGNSATGGFRSYGSNTSSDHALGFAGASNFGTYNQTNFNGNYAGAVAQFTNVTGGTITSLVVSFTGEQWRQATAAASFITVGYSVSSASGAVVNAISSPLSGTTFNAISASNALGSGNNNTANSILNGDAPANRITTFTATITGLNILSGASINLAFVYAGGTGGGNRQGLAIDDLSVLANGVAAAASLLWSGADGETWDTTNARFSAGTATWNNTANATTTAEFATAAQTINVGTVTAGGVKFSNTGITLNGGTITDGNGSGGVAVDVGTGDTATLNSSVSTANGLTKVGSGTLVLGGTQAALGGTITVSSGTLQSDTTTVGTKNITNNGTLTFAQNADGAYSGALANAGIFNKNGSGNLTINTAVTGTGVTNINGGTLTAGVTNAISTGALSLASGTTFDLATHDATTSGLTLTGGTVTVGATVPGGTLTGGTFTVTGGITTNADATTSTISGGTLALGTAARTVTVNAGSALTVSSNLTGAGTLTKAGTGTLTLTGTNNGTDPDTSLPIGFTGGLTMTAGTIVASSSSISSGTLTFGGGTLQANGSAWDISNKVQVGTGSLVTNSVLEGSTDIIFEGPMQQAGAATNTFTVNNTGNTVFNGAVDLTAANSMRTLTIAGSGNVTINGIISESSVGVSAVGALGKSGSGTLTLTAANTYNGTTALSGGTLVAANNTAFSTGAVSVTGGMLSISNGITLANAITTGAAGTISGTGSAALSGTIRGSGSFAGSLTLANGANFSPGTTGAGLTTNTNALTFDVGSTYQWDLISLKDSITGAAGADFDQLVNTGSINVSSSALLTLTLSLLAPDQSLSSFWNTNHSWTVVSSSSGGTITGTALHLSNDQSAWASRGSFTTALVGNNLELNWTAAAIPEPSTYAAILGVVALAGVIIRKRRQQAALAKVA